MTGDFHKTIELDKVIIQENGIIRNNQGHIIGRLVNEVSFDSKHLRDLKTPIHKTENVRR